MISNSICIAHGEGVAPFLTWKSRKTHSTVTIPSSKRLPLQPSFSLYSFRPIRSRKFQISSHFARGSSRQNYLRKKLHQKQKQQVGENLVHEFDKGDAYESQKIASSSESSLGLEKSSSIYDVSFDNCSEDSKNVDDNFSQNGGVEESKEGFGKKKIGEPIMWNKLESWVEQYKKDSEFWGIGGGPIFTVFMDGEGKVERVEVNEDEIMKRSRVDTRLDSEMEDMAEVEFKMSFAKDLAREMENGSNVIPKNSSVAKFMMSGAGESSSTEATHGVTTKSSCNVNPKDSSVAKFLKSGAGKSRFMEAISSDTLKPFSFPSLSRVGVLVFCGLAVIWGIRGLLSVGNDRREYTMFEKEMLRRKLKARKEEQEMVKGSVEVVMQDPVEPKGVSFTRPQLDKELLNSIIKAKGSNMQLEITQHATPANELQGKIEEIRAMARHARETERRDSLPKSSSDETPETELSSDDEKDEEEEEEEEEEEKEVYDSVSDETEEYLSATDIDGVDGVSVNGASDEKCERQLYNIPNGAESLRAEVSNEKVVRVHSDLTEANLHSDGPDSSQYKDSLRKKLRIIKSAKEAKEYLSRKHDIGKVNLNNDVEDDEHSDGSSRVPGAYVAFDNTSQIMDSTLKVHNHPPTSGINDFSYRSEDCSMVGEIAEGNKDTLNNSETSRVSPDCEVSICNEGEGIPIDKIHRIKEIDIRTTQTSCSNSKSDTSTFLGEGDIQTSESTEDDNEGHFQVQKVRIELKNHISEEAAKDEISIGLQESNEVTDRNAERAPSVNKENWMEKNFHEFEPIIEKIGVGFRDNYHIAREKASQELDPEADLAQLKSEDAENELEWMKDERLREIVFKVRDNELSGRDPFHLMHEEDKRTFFSGLEKKVQQENIKLLKLHEYFHSNIENLDYGADGISLYDPPEKIIPRWKDPPAERNPEFLNNFVEQRKELVAESLKNSLRSKKTAKEAVDKSEELSSHENGTVTADDSVPGKEIKKDNLVSSKTVVESSDGSVKAGKRSGKEFWQHTKKWSEGFLQSYNEESDPEVKAVMRDMGKDLDRWITEKEVKEAAELMERLPEKGFVKQKLNKLRREMELYGAPAVVSKYREYADVKEEDYLWWLDLRHVLCIELYTVENGEQRVGFYSLEMAADLELDPKPYHVIAFEDAGDCKNLCYIIQAKMEVLGNGNAFVVARPPKDAFREAKANGFGVTVIRKGQLKLNIDQTLEEVEELIEEIGSKIYHDKITKERSVDVNGLMKGVFGVSKPSKRNRKRLKRKLKRRINP